MKSSLILSRIRSAIAPTNLIKNSSVADSSQKFIDTLINLYPFTSDEIHFLHIQTGKDYKVTEKLLAYSVKNRLTVEEAVDLHQYMNYSA